MKLSIKRTLNDDLTHIDETRDDTSLSPFIRFYIILACICTTLGYTIVNPHIQLFRL